MNRKENEEIRGEGQSLVTKRENEPCIVIECWHLKSKSPK